MPINNFKTFITRNHSADDGYNNAILSGTNLDSRVLKSHQAPVEVLSIVLLLAASAATQHGRRRLPHYVAAQHRLKQDNIYFGALLSNTAFLILNWTQ